MNEPLDEVQQFILEFVNLNDMDAIYGCTCVIYDIRERVLNFIEKSENTVPFTIQAVRNNRKDFMEVVIWIESALVGRLLLKRDTDVKLLPSFLAPDHPHTVNIPKEDVECAISWKFI